MALLHSACDAFEPPHGFSRVHWNIDGLLGEHPLWGRFWENPTLDEDTRILFKAFRARVHHELEAVGGTLDKGLIHADLVRDNVLVDGTTLRLIDFDDGGFGFRLFDVATALLKNRSEPNYTGLKQALLNGYLSARDLDMARLDMFLALRAVTYVGWIVPRMNEEGARARNASFIADARDLCSAYLDTETES
jgi:Ser/Thr protein kinase RdoA (MazF antagonist)